MPDAALFDAQAAEQAARAALRTDRATAALAELPFRPVPGGLSNFAWHVAGARAADCFVRYAGRYGEQLGADYTAECRVLELTARHGLSPPLVRCDPDARLLVTRWIESPRVGRPLRDVATLGLVAQTLASLHELPPPRETRSVRFDERAQALESAFQPDTTARSLRGLARDVFDLLRAEAPKPVLCHHDLNPPNVLLDGDGRLWLVDWEYAGLGDAAIDLASFANQHGLDARQRARLLDGYRHAGRTLEPTRFDLARWAFDYVQWAWYRAALARPDAGLVAEVARGHVARLGMSLRRRASGVLRCNNAAFTN
jgi:thiamine kinase